MVLSSFRTLSKRLRADVTHQWRSNYYMNCYMRSLPARMGFGVGKRRRPGPRPAVLAGSRSAAEERPQDQTEDQHRRDKHLRNERGTELGELKQREEVPLR